MSEWYLLLAPVAALAVLALVRFVGALSRGRISSHIMIGLHV